jgi:predicted Zn-ribbon and HTH transcriptional regulator
MIEIDKIKHCPICRGTAIFHVDDMVGKDCPKCLSGKILDNIYAIT